jgi:hypothetical protein
MYTQIRSVIHYKDTLWGILLWVGILVLSGLNLSNILVFLSIACMILYAFVSLLVILYWCRIHIKKTLLGIIVWLRAFVLVNAVILWLSGLLDKSLYSQTPNYQAVVLALGGMFFVLYILFKTIQSQPVSIKHTLIPFIMGIVVLYCFAIEIFFYGFA